VTSITPDASRNLENITFDTSAAAYTIGTTGGNALLMTSGGTIQIASTFSGSNLNETINAPLTLEGDYTLADNSAHTGVSLDFGGAISAADKPGGGSVLTVAGAGNTAISGAIGGIKTIDLVKSGAGTLTLSGNNTFTGGVTINAGTLQVDSAGALNSNSPNAVTFGSGSNGTLSLNGNSVTVAGLNGDSSATVSGSGAALTINNAGNDSYYGFLIGGMSVVKTGAGTLFLGNGNSFGGGLQVQQGTLAVTAINSEGTNGPLGPNPVTLGSSGHTGTLEWEGFMSDFQDAHFFTLQGGGAILAANSPLNLGGFIMGPGGLTIVSGLAVTLSNYGNSFSGGLNVDGFLVIPSINNAGTNGTLGANTSVTLGSNAVSGTLEYSGATASSTMAFTLSSSGGNFQIDSSSTNLTLSGVIGGTGALTKTGDGTLTLSGNNTYSGGTLINFGTLNVAADNNLGAVPGSPVTNITFNQGTYSTLQFAGAMSLSANRWILLNGFGGTIDTQANAISVPGVIAGAGSLTKVGAGTLTLSGNNTYSGGTIVSGGTLRTTGAGTLGAGPLAINAASGVTSSVNLGNNQNVSSLSGTVSGTGAVSLSIGSGVTLTDNQSSGNTTFQGVLINSGTFAKSGTSSLEINSAPTLNANSMLQVNAGKLRFNFVSGAATIGTGVTATVASGATLELAGSVSALSSGADRVNVMNSSNSPGLLVSGTHQQVGNIDGSGATQVNAGSDLTANHVVQSALIIGGTSGSPALVMIDASDASGNSLGQSSGLVLAGSLAPSDPFGAPDMSSASLSTATTDSTDLAVPAAGNSVGIGNASQVPEPSTLLLALLAVLGVGRIQFVRHHFRSQTVRPA
jgi:autotransporter-associated beta strand protein